MLSSGQMSAEKEMKDSDRLFASLIRTAEERRVEANTEITARQKFAEMRSEELVKELQKEIAELQWRNAELGELTDSEDHLHLLQVQPAVVQEVFFFAKWNPLECVLFPHFVCVLQRSPHLMTPPPSKEWMEIGIHPELCVGTVTRALSKVNNAVQNELETLKMEGKLN